MPNTAYHCSHSDKKGNNSYNLFKIYVKKRHENSCLDVILVLPIIITSQERCSRKLKNTSRFKAPQDLPI